MRSLEHARTPCVQQGMRALVRGGIGRVSGSGDGVASMDMAMARLEAAVEHLGSQIARLRAAPPRPAAEAAAEDMVPRAEVAALAARLDAALLALRGALAQEAGDAPEDQE